MADKVTKSERTRQRILDAAAAVFSENGYSNARLVDIAERAGMQAGSLYYHFDSREALVDEILRLGIETAWDHVRAAVDGLGDDADPVEKLAAAVRAHTMVVLEISDYASAQTRIVGQVPPELAKPHYRDQRKYGEYWHGLLLGVAATGRLRSDIDIFSARMLAFGAMNWTSEWFDAGRGLSADEVADQAVLVVLGGLLSEGATSLM
jgi:AcrR family transcriptional regulator